MNKRSIHACILIRVQYIVKDYAERTKKILNAQSMVDYYWRVAVERGHDVKSDVFCCRARRSFSTALANFIVGHLIQRLVDISDTTGVVAWHQVSFGAESPCAEHCDSYRLQHFLRHTSHRRVEWSCLVSAFEARRSVSVRQTLHNNDRLF